MEKELNKSKNKSKDSKLTKKINKLRKVFKEINPNIQAVTEDLIEEASFMAVLLEDLREHIRIHGIKEEYKNGANQYGYKQSVEAKQYNELIGKYRAIINQLTTLVCKELNTEEDDDELSEFY